jgi:hypothetical protein
MTLPPHVQIDAIAANEEDRMGLKRKSHHMTPLGLLPGTPDRLSPDAGHKISAFSPSESVISHSFQRTKGRKVGANNKRFLSLFDLARCLNESRDYDYPDRSVNDKNVVIIHFVDRSLNCTGL